VFVQAFVRAFMEAFMRAFALNFVFIEVQVEVLKTAPSGQRLCLTLRTAEQHDSITIIPGRLAVGVRTCTPEVLCRRFYTLISSGV
jgi:hypothetical protein